MGGSTTWDVGRRGGEDALHRHVPARICARIRCVGCLAKSLPHRLRRGLYLALLLDCLAWRGLRTPRDPAVVGNAPEVVGSAACRTSGCRRLLRDMEDTWSAQISYYGKQYIANQKGSCGLSSNGRHLLFLMFISVLAAYSSRALLEFGKRKAAGQVYPAANEPNLKSIVFVLATLLLLRSRLWLPRLQCLLL